MSLENRSNSALFKRAEQLKRWDESETNRESIIPKRDRRKVKFSAGCVFLAACAAGDREEVQRLIQNGADIDTANVDGLTALHQACIDDNLEMVEFLVSRGADVNRGDNEGWTPLHATASCGFLSIARLLMERGADVAAVNNDGELPLDIAESDDMEFLLFSNVTSQGIDCDAARNKEERLMLADAKEWLNNGEICDKPHPKTGATALHVAAAKGYKKVIELLLQAGGDINVQDLDGWTPLHAASHWAQKEACELLIDNLCDMDVKNYVGQTAEDVADPDLTSYLDDLRKKQAVLLRGRNISGAILPPAKRASVGNQSGGKRRSLDNSISANNNNITTQTTNNQQIKDVSAERQLLGPAQRGSAEEATESEETTTSTSEESEIEKRNRANKGETTGRETTKSVPFPAPSSPPKPPLDSDESGVPSWRRPGSLRSRTNGRDERASNRVSDRNSVESNSSEVVLRRTHSFESDDKFYRQYKALQERIKASSCPVLAHPTPLANLRSNASSSKPWHGRFAISEKRESANSAPASPAKTPASPSSLGTPSSGQVRSMSLPVSATAPATPATPTTPTTPGGSKLSPGNIFKNFFKSFVPPVRDEESETQRKAHAKRVRETRRSTQGVTLEEIKSAEQLVKKKNQQSEPQSAAVPTSQPTDVSASATVAMTTPVVAVTTPHVPEVTDEANKTERRPSWRLKVDTGSKFLLEDARGGESSSRRATTNSTPSPSVTTSRNSATENNVDSSVTVALRRGAAKPVPAPAEDKDQDKENDSRNAQATQAVIQRRRRPKRRSTGVVHVDMDEIDPDRQDGGAGDGEDVKHSEESDRSGRSSRLSSISSQSAADAAEDATSHQDENGDLDYKKLYEESRVDNERLRYRLRRVEEELKVTKADQSGAKSSMSETEKRERRAMERKLSEMEEELKQFQKLKAENEKLKAENRALTRVVSKLSQTVQNAPK